MDEQAIFIAGWILTGIIAIAAIGLAIYQHRTGGEWSDKKTERVMDALKSVGTTLVRALQDGIVTKDEIRIILESVVKVLAEVASKDPKEAANEIPGAAEEIEALDDITIDTSDEQPVGITQK